MNAALFSDSRATQAGDVFYTTWHSTGVFDAWSVSGWYWLGQRALGTYDNWIEGVSVVDEEIYIAGYGGPGGAGDQTGVFSFPTTGGAETGEWLLGPYTDWRIHGLSCARR